MYRQGGGGNQRDINKRDQTTIHHKRGAKVCLSQTPMEQFLAPDFDWPMLLCLDRILFGAAGGGFIQAIQGRNQASLIRKRDRFLVIVALRGKGGQEVFTHINRPVPNRVSNRFRIIHQCICHGFRGHRVKQSILFLLLVLLVLLLLFWWAVIDRLPQKIPDKRKGFYHLINKP